MSNSFASFSPMVHPVTGDSVSRATRILSQFASGLNPTIVAEVYDAVLLAKSNGISQSAVFAQFANKYNITGELLAKIESVMAATK
jgi:hypothetical protein